MAGKISATYVCDGWTEEWVGYSDTSRCVNDGEFLWTRASISGSGERQCVTVTTEEYARTRKVERFEPPRYGVQAKHSPP